MKDWGAFVSGAVDAFRDLLNASEKDVEMLEVSCARESERQGKKVLPRLGASVVIDGEGVVMSLSYGARVKRETAFTVEDPDQEKLPGMESSKGRRGGGE